MFYNSKTTENLNMLKTFYVFFKKKMEFHSFLWDSKINSLAQKLFFVIFSEVRFGSPTYRALP